jgi:cyanophycinase
MRRLLFTVAAVAALSACASAPRITPTTVAGPARGSLVIVGGGTIGPEVNARFIELAGGPNARIVILPAAGDQDTFPDNWSGYRVFRDAGVASVTAMHTRDRTVANTEAFARQLRTATGVWIPGGRQWRLVDSYLDTRTVKELQALLDRGGVIGGTSAGASIISSYMVRGAVEGNTIMMAPGYERGFGLLRNAAVDQHLLARGRQGDMLAVIEKHPELLGIGIDESTAIVVTGDRAEVMGPSKVAFYNARDRGSLPYYFLEAGDVFDLANRRVEKGTKQAPATVIDERAVIASMNRLFDAMRSKDTVNIRKLLHPDLRIFVPGVQGDAPRVRVSNVDTFVRSIAASTDRLDERPFDPEVRVDGNLASVWTYYEFRTGTTFSHCGSDAFQLARLSDGWQVIGLSYTTQRENCRTAGAPR